MILHQLTAAAGSVKVDQCSRLVVCDAHDQPVAVFLEMNGQILSATRGSKLFDQAIDLLGIGKKAETVDLDFRGTR